MYSENQQHKTECPAVNPELVKGKSTLLPEGPLTIFFCAILAIVKASEQCCNKNVVSFVLLFSLGYGYEKLK